MAKFDWKETLGAVAPALATALGGPLAGAAVKAVSVAVLGKENASEKEIEAVVATQSPDILLQLRRADQDFKLQMEKLGVDLEQVHQKDRESARAREIALKDHTPAVLAYGVTLGFFATLWYCFVHGMPSEGGEALLIMLGSLGTAWSGIIAYYYGSSAGSARKDTLLHQSKPID